jgi:hypothetical protein
MRINPRRDNREASTKPRSGERGKSSGVWDVKLLHFEAVCERLCEIDVEWRLGDCLDGTILRQLALLRAIPGFFVARIRSLDHRYKFFSMTILLTCLEYRVVFDFSA